MAFTRETSKKRHSSEIPFLPLLPQICLVIWASWLLDHQDSDPPFQSQKKKKGLFISGFWRETFRKDISSNPIHLSCFVMMPRHKTQDLLLDQNKLPWQCSFHTVLARMHCLCFSSAWGCLTWSQKCTKGKWTFPLNNEILSKIYQYVMKLIAVITVHLINKETPF